MTFSNQIVKISVYNNCFSWSSHHLTYVLNKILQCTGNPSMIQTTFSFISTLGCPPFFFNSQCFFWLVVRERRAQPQTILLVQMQQTFQGVAKVLLESSGRFKVHNYVNNNNNNDWFVISMHPSCGCMQKVAKHNRSYSKRW